MTAIINPPSSSTTAFDLVCKIDTNEFISSAVLLKHEEGVIVCSGKNVRIWLKRESGQYWPSVSKTLNSPCTCLDYNYETQRLFVGQESGVISEFSVADDYNKLIHIKDYFAHSSNVISVIFALCCEWVLSIGGDKHFIWHCSETARRLGFFDAAEFCYSLQFDAPAKYAFIGDYAGNISIIRLRENCYELITRLNAHAGCIKTMVWDAERQLLFSGSYDKLIIVWDIGSKKGSAVELYGHDGKIVDVKLAEGSKKLFSADDSGAIMCWNTNIDRKETPPWQSSDACEQCNSPFFWNVKDMWQKRVIGLRQHHCRICGRAICDKCSQNRLKYPPMGYELPVRLCDQCYRQHEGQSFEPLAIPHHTKHSLVCLSLDEMTGQLLTAGKDKHFKIWDVKKVLV